MPFSYYERLTELDKATYRRSDEIRAIRLPRREELLPIVAHLRAALTAADADAVAVAAECLADGITRALEVDRVRIAVLAERPRLEDSELHGLYTIDRQGVAVVRVWMRTARHGRVVAFRTFLRTMIHELCHHLDFALLGLERSFHTRGFFQRETSLFHQLVPEVRRRPPKHVRPS